MFINCLLLLSLYLLTQTNSIVVDQNNYFYLNTSYAKQAISFSMCFHVNESTQIKLISEVLIPDGNNHVTIGTMEDQKAINFDYPFDSDLVGYNNYDSGEYWFGVKIKYPNPQKYDFVRLQMHYRQGMRIIAYTFLQPLYTLPLNGIQIYPVNTLFSCHNQILLSYLYNFEEVDFYAFGAKNSSDFRVREAKNWGFYRQDFNANYLRHKSKSYSQINFEFTLNKSKFQCKINESHLARSQKISDDVIGYQLGDILIKSTPISQQTSNNQQAIPKQQQKEIRDEL